MRATVYRLINEIPPRIIDQPQIEAPFPKIGLIQLRKGQRTNFDIHHIIFIFGLGSFSQKSHFLGLRVMRKLVVKIQRIKN